MDNKATIAISDLVSHKGSIYKRLIAGGFDGYEQLRVPEAQPITHWVGPKITIDAWYEACGFMAAVFNDKKNEAQLRLFRSSSHGMVFIPFPQYGSPGSVTEDVSEESTRKQNELRSALGPDVEEVGTVHSHCTMGAFQSGTDHNDEHNATGLHLTVGHLDRTPWDLHGRVVLNRATYEPIYQDWFQLDPKYDDLPFEILENLIKYKLTHLPKTLYYPAHWKDLVIEPPERTGHALHDHWKGTPYYNEDEWEVMPGGGYRKLTTAEISVRRMERWEKERLERDEHWIQQQRRKQVKKDMKEAAKNNKKFGNLAREILGFPAKDQDKPAANDYPCNAD